jgi:hypothetical protein
MKVSKLGILAASAVATLLGTATFAAEGSEGSASGDKACYRASCGKSIKGHEGKCSGTRVDELKDEAACKEAGGAWTTAAEAKKNTKHDG